MEANRMIAGVAACLMVPGLPGGCSAPFTHDARSSAGSTSDGAMQAGADETRETYPASTLTKQFTACLVAKGFDARITGERNNQVALLEIDAAGNPVQPKVTAGDDGVTNRDWTGDPNLYPNITSSGVNSNTVTGDDFPYIIAQNSGQLAGSPYASKQADYAACEARYSSFSQGVTTYTADDVDASAEDKAAVLEFARDARDKGFDWVADPVGDEPLHIVIPNTVPESDVRRFFEECPTDDVPVIFSWIGDYPYDINAVQQSTVR
ncbi:hypothetical protein [Bifidobacterium saguinibicoloris]|uniref:hypothetical protein n=1 Tax=Bifidobacterium saguinibicoloris TaxID=2834433 RepID=UPI001C58A3C2|nr:hypothetical protein [Bifidobacterium saguinibicoloris]MBW3079917.1 hypothetical protein [Bifidobacterium saguinibicoloris]